MGDKEKGITHKFQVRRTDGTDGPGEKHEFCNYFVLDLDHDPIGRYAAWHYAQEALRQGYEKLGRDLLSYLAETQAEHDAYLASKQPNIEEQEEGDE